MTETQGDLFSLTMSGTSGGVVGFALWGVGKGNPAPPSPDESEGTRGGLHGGAGTSVSRGRGWEPASVCPSPEFPRARRPWGSCSPVSGFLGKHHLCIQFSKAFPRNPLRLLGDESASVSSSLGGELIAEGSLETGADPQPPAPCSEACLGSRGSSRLLGSHLLLLLFGGGGRGEHCRFPAAA